jgi:diadenosine tetraphosphate (Ap4A) HIT family hydrolase/uracil-DNA glycosylase
MSEIERLILPGFGAIESERVVSVDEMFAVVRDKFPVSAGHTLIIARRAVQFFRELSHAERVRLMELVSEVQNALLRSSPEPDGFNLGVNDGPAAGQTIPQFHFHVIPRYAGDVGDPRGGIRWVKSDTARYWASEPGASNTTASREAQARRLDASELRNEVFWCDACAQVKAFRRPSEDKPFYKFPPLIGAQKRVPLLFIGINPRRSKGNEQLHDWLMSSPANFAELANNLQPGGKRYICRDGDEEHYHSHAMIVEGVFGPDTAFESKASVTELFLCASESGSALLNAGASACATRFLKESIELVDPAILVAVGATVRKHLQRHFPELLKVPVVEMVHPRELFGRCECEKRAMLRAAIDKIRNFLRI